MIITPDSPRLTSCESHETKKNFPENGKVRNQNKRAAEKMRSSINFRRLISIYLLCE